MCSISVPSTSANSSALGMSQRCSAGLEREEPQHHHCRRNRRVEEELGIFGTTWNWLKQCCRAIKKQFSFRVGVEDDEELDDEEAHLREGEGTYIINIVRRYIGMAAKI